MSTDVAAPESAEVEQVDAAAAAARALANVQQTDLVLPALKVTQQLSREVTTGKAESGQFLNSLTGESLGDDLDLIVVHYFRGRFYSPKDVDRTWVATGDVAPGDWPEQYAGRRFDELPDAEEVYKERSNNEEGFEWGSGPPISTTHNFVGFLPSDDEDARPLPLRLSLMRSSAPAARKIISLITFEGAPWNQAVKLTLNQEQDSQKRPYFVVEASRGRQTTADERDAAARLAVQVQRAEIQRSLKLAGDADERKERKAAAQASGGLDVD